jgi:hypothetical protein
MERYVCRLLFSTTSRAVTETVLQKEERLFIALIEDIRLEVAFVFLVFAH